MSQSTTASPVAEHPAPHTQHAAPAGFLRTEIEGLHKLSFLMLILGVALILVGMMAMSATFMATLATVVVLGSLLMAGGIAQILNAFFARGWRGFGLHMLVGIIYLVIGLLMINRPEKTAEFFTLMIAAGLFVGGAYRIFASVTARFHGWVWTLFNGVISLILGVMIWREWPESALWVIGLFVGIDMVFAGMAWVMTALTARSATANALK
ncbi:MAG TPA: HdeD family acid-resistance protein [Gemmataceae bacterium]|nr:HdeD family acid-resistance protein [Gemmataceae bacterium]